MLSKVTRHYKMLLHSEKFEKPRTLENRFLELPRPKGRLLKIASSFSSRNPSSDKSLISSKISDLISIGTIRLKVMVIINHMHILLLKLYYKTPRQNRFKWNVGFKAKDYSNLRYWCSRVQKNKKWKSSDMGIKSYQLTSAGQSTNHGQTGRHWLAGNSYHVRRFSFLFFWTLGQQYRRFE